MFFEYPDSEGLEEELETTTRRLTYLLIAIVLMVLSAWGAVYLAPHNVVIHGCDDFGSYKL